LDCCVLPLGPKVLDQCPDTPSREKPQVQGLTPLKVARKKNFSAIHPCSFVDARHSVTLYELHCQEILSTSRGLASEPWWAFEPHPTFTSRSLPSTSQDCRRRMIVARASQRHGQKGAPKDKLWFVTNRFIACFCRVVARLVSAVEQNPALCGICAWKLPWQNNQRPTCSSNRRPGCLLLQRHDGDTLADLSCALSQFSSYRTPRLAAIGSVSMA
jgi:hypothetical protein